MACHPLSLFSGTNKNSGVVYSETSTLGEYLLVSHLPHQRKSIPTEQCLPTTSLIFPRLEGIPSTDNSLLAGAIQYYCQSSSIMLHYMAATNHKWLLHLN